MSKEDDLENKVFNKKKRDVRNHFMNTDDNSDVNIKNNTNDDVDDVFSKYKSKKKTHSDLVGIYFDSDVKKQLSNMQEEFGRGFKSEYVNELVRKDMNRRGYLDH